MSRQIWLMSSEARILEPVWCHLSGVPGSPGVSQTAPGFAGRSLLFEYQAFSAVFIPITE